MNCVWNKGNKRSSDVKEENALPTGSTVLYDFHYHPHAKEYLKDFISTTANKNFTNE
jgi:hypothetical protein